MRCNIPNALNLEQLGIKILKCALLLDLSVPFFRYTARMPIIFGIIKTIRVIKIGVHPFSHAVSRHQIVLATINLKTEYPPLSYVFIWNCKNGDANCINHSIESFD